MHAKRRWNFFFSESVDACERSINIRAVGGHKMICSQCQREIADYSNFCYFCGTRQDVSPNGPPRIPKRLMRSVMDRKIAGVCGGIAEYLEVDSTIIRLLWVLAIILPIPLVPAFLGYIVAWLVMPEVPISCYHRAPDRPSTIPNSPQAT